MIDVKYVMESRCWPVSMVDRLRMRIHLGKRDNARLGKYCGTPASRHRRAKKGMDRITNILDLLLQLIVLFGSLL